MVLMRKDLLSATAEAFVGGDFTVDEAFRATCVHHYGRCFRQGHRGHFSVVGGQDRAFRICVGGIGPARMVANLNEFLLGFSRVETFATLLLAWLILQRVFSRTARRDPSCGARACGYG